MNSSTTAFGSAADVAPPSAEGGAKGGAAVLEDEGPRGIAASNGNNVATNKHAHGRTQSSSFQETNNRDDHNNDDDATAGSTFFELVVTLYLPLLLLWFRRSMFGSVNVIRSLIVGQVVRLAVSHGSEYMDRKSPAWLQTLFKHLSQSLAAFVNRGGRSGTAAAVAATTTQTSGSGGSSLLFPYTPTDSQTWPQNFLTALAMFTFFALVVHPDGLTWVVLGKLRDYVSNVCSAVASCWEVLGIFPTIAAILTLAALFFLIVLVIHTLSPRQKRPPQSPERGKKKKKKGHNSRGGRRGEQHHHNQRGSMSSRFARPSQRSAEILATEDADGNSTGGCDRVLTPLPELSAAHPTPAHSTLSPSSTATDVVNRDGLVSKSDRPLATKPNSAIKPASSDLKTKQEGAVGGVGGKDKRIRISSASTQDTTPLLDDISCGSTSVRSFPSVSVGSGRSNDRAATNKGTPSRQGGKRGGTQKMGAAAESIVPSSRWDALKPDNDSDATSSSNQNRQYGNNHHGPQARQNQHPLAHCHRGSNFRRSGNSGKRTGQRLQPLMATAAETSGLFFATSPMSATSTPSKLGAVGGKSHNVDFHEESVVGINLRFGSGTMPPASPPPGFQNAPSPMRQQPQSEVTLQWVQPASTNGNAGLEHGQVTPLFESTSYGATTAGDVDNWHEATQLFPSPSVVPGSSLVNLPGVVGTERRERSFVPLGGASTLKENPFDDSERQIEEELQELGGQMAGSILDF